MIWMTILSLIFSILVVYTYKDPSTCLMILTIFTGLTWISNLFECCLYAAILSRDSLRGD